jgi:hypothetical protein
VIIAGDDWFGPVTWSDADGSTGSLEGEELLAKTAPLAHTHQNPDAAFVLSAVQQEPGFPTSLLRSKPIGLWKQCMQVHEPAVLPSMFLR